MEQVYDTKELLRQAEEETTHVELSVLSQKLDVEALHAEVDSLEQEIREQELVTIETKEVESSFSAAKIEAERGGRRA